MTHSHMLLDWRLYASLHALMGLSYLFSLVFLEKDWWGRYFACVCLSWGFLAFINFLDWIWS